MSAEIPLPPLHHQPEQRYPWRDGAISSTLPGPKDVEPLGGFSRCLREKPSIWSLSVQFV